MRGRTCARQDESDHTQLRNNERQVRASRQSEAFMMKKRTTLTRRDFVRAAGAAAATFMIVPRHVVAGAGVNPPSERLNIAGIGVGGMGAGDIGAVATDNNIVALCDVDQNRSAET